MAIARDDNRKGLIPWLRYSAIFATACSAWVAIAAVATHGANTARYGSSLGQLIALAFGGSALVGIIVGLLNPYATTRVKGILVAVCAMVPVVLLASLMVFPEVSFVRMAKGSLLLGAILGTLYGLVAWER